MALIVTVCFTGAFALVTSAFILVRVVVPRVEGWCARRNNRVLAALAMAEDAHLPWEAKQRARKLFLSKLDEGQRRAWHLRRRFAAVAPSGRRYVIGSYRPFNIHTPGAAFCVQVHGNIPVYDKLLAQKLLIETDEQLFFARANVRSFSNTWEPLMAAARAAR